MTSELLHEIAESMDLTGATGICTHHDNGGIPVVNILMPGKGRARMISEVVPHGACQGTGCTHCNWRGLIEVNRPAPTLRELAVKAKALGEER